MPGLVVAAKRRNGSGSFGRNTAQSALTYGVSITVSYRRPRASASCYRTDASIKIQRTIGPFSAGPALPRATSISFRSTASRTGETTSRCSLRATRILDPNEERVVSSAVLFDEVEIELPEFPTLPEIHIFGLDDDAVRQDFIVEVWIEKSTQNDWLVPLCTRRGVNLVVGIGEQSETRSRELALRSVKYAVPVRIIYISDFDPGGRSMPKAVARKVEFTISKLGLDVDVQLIPLAMTPEQCRYYNLPRTPIKETEKRKDKFEQIFGVGATELDALEALHPGELARLLEAELDNFLDPNLKQRVQRAYRDQMLPLDQLETEVKAEHTEQIEAITNRFETILSDLDTLKDEADELWQTIAEEMEERLPDSSDVLSQVEIPRSEAPGETDSFVLFDSKRDYFTQMDFYNSWREGDDD